MIEIEKMKCMELDILNDFEQRLEEILNDMDIYRDCIKQKESKKFESCYGYLDSLWTRVDSTIEKIKSI